MRLITNEELVFVAGGGDGAEDSIPQVEVVGERMSIWEKIWDSVSNFFSSSGSSLSNADYDRLQAAYVYANETGSPVNVELSSGGGELGGDYKVVNAKVQFSGAKYTVTVKPAGGTGTNLP